MTQDTMVWEVYYKDKFLGRGYTAQRANIIRKAIRDGIVPRHYRAGTIKHSLIKV